jgi:hypothetical protein
MPKDPIPDVGTDVGRALFQEFVRVSNGKPIEDVLSACANMIANCLRQNYGLRSEVEARMKELYGRSMEVLLQHYDATTGRRRSVIPFDQVVRPQMILSDEMFTNLGDGRKDH